MKLQQCVFPVQTADNMEAQKNTCEPCNAPKQTSPRLDLIPGFVIMLLSDNKTKDGISYVSFLLLGGLQFWLDYHSRCRSS